MNNLNGGQSIIPKEFAVFVLILMACAPVYIYFERQLTDGFISKAGAITKSIEKNIEGIDEETNKAFNDKLAKTITDNIEMQKGYLNYISISDQNGSIIMEQGDKDEQG